MRQISVHFLGKAGTDSKLGDAKAGAAAGKSPAKPDPKDKKDVKPVDTKPKEEKKGKVDLKKEKNSFGLGLVGGSDTPLVRIYLILRRLDPMETNL